MHDFVAPDDCLWEKVARTTELKLGVGFNEARAVMPWKTCQIGLYTVSALWANSACTPSR